MSGEPSSSRTKITTINRVSDDNVEQIDNQMAVAVPAPPVAQANRCEIFKLDVDCCEEIFEWLSIVELLSLGQTCKRMNRIAGMYFQHNYPRVRPRSTPDGIYYKNDYESIKMDSLSEFIEEIFISRDVTTHQLEYIAANCKSLKRVRFDFHHYPTILNELHLIRDVLAKAEEIDINGKYPDGNILDLCPNLTHFKSRWENADFLFKLNKCPKLEFIRFAKIRDNVVNVDAFFNQIPNIRTLDIHVRFLLANTDQFLNSNVKLENLVINHYIDTLACTILNKLHDRGFYERLHLNMKGSLNQEQINEMVSLRALETLCIDNVQSDVVWPVIENVKKLAIRNGYHIDLEAVASKLPNLKSFCLFDDYVEFILPFIRESKKLSSIIMWYDYGPGPEDGEEGFDLVVLNKERQKLNGACKVIIRVPEDVFLDSKFEVGTSRNLVEIKREETAKWTDSWNWFLH